MTNIKQYSPSVAYFKTLGDNLKIFENKKIIKAYSSYKEIKLLFEDNSYVIFTTSLDYDGVPELNIKEKENIRDKAFTMFNFGLISKKEYDEIEKKWREDINKRKEQEEKELLEKLKKKYEGGKNA